MVRYGLPAATSGARVHLDCACPRRRAQPALRTLHAPPYIQAAISTAQSAGPPADDDDFATTAPSSAQNSAPGTPSASPDRPLEATPALGSDAQHAEPAQPTLWQRLCALVFAGPEPARGHMPAASAQAHPITLSASQYTATPLTSVTPCVAPQPRFSERGQPAPGPTSHLPDLESPLLAPHVRPEAPSPLQTPALFGRFPPSHPTSLGVGDPSTPAATPATPMRSQRSSTAAPPQFDSPVSHFLVARQHRQSTCADAGGPPRIEPPAADANSSTASATRAELRLTARQRRGGRGLPCAILAESDSGTGSDSGGDDDRDGLHGYVPAEQDNDKELLMVRDTCNVQRRHVVNMRSAGRQTVQFCGAAGAARPVLWRRASGRVQALHRGVGVSASQPAPRDWADARWQDSDEAKQALARLHSWHAQERATMDSIRCACWLRTICAVHK